MTDFLFDGKESPSNLPTFPLVLFNPRRPLTAPKSAAHRIRRRRNRGLCRSVSVMPALCESDAGACEKSAGPGHASCSASWPSRMPDTRSIRRCRWCDAMASNRRTKRLSECKPGGYGSSDLADPRLQMPRKTEKTGCPLANRVLNLSCRMSAWLVPL